MIKSVIRKLRVLELGASATSTKEEKKSTRFFLNLEIRNAIENQVKSLVVNNEVVNEQIDLNIKTYILFIKSFFPKITTFLNERYCNIYKIKAFRN